jgi:hypothetical protein
VQSSAGVDSAANGVQLNVSSRIRKEVGIDLGEEMTVIDGFPAIEVFGCSDSGSFKDRFERVKGFGDVDALACPMLLEALHDGKSLVVGPKPASGGYKDSVPDQKAAQ